MSTTVRELLDGPRSKTKTSKASMDTTLERMERNQQLLSLVIDETLALYGEKNNPWLPKMVAANANTRATGLFASNRSMYLDSLCDGLADGIKPVTTDRHNWDKNSYDRYMNHFRIGCCKSNNGEYDERFLFNVKVDGKKFLLFAKSPTVMDTSPSSSDNQSQPLLGGRGKQDYGLGSAFDDRDEIALPDIQTDFFQQKYYFRMNAAKSPLGIAEAQCKSYFRGTLHITGTSTLNNLYHVMVDNVLTMAAQILVDAFYFPEYLHLPRMILTGYDPQRQNPMPHVKIYDNLATAGGISLSDAQGMCFSRVIYNRGPRIFEIDTRIAMRRMTADFARNFVHRVYNITDTILHPAYVRAAPKSKYTGIQTTAGGVSEAVSVERMGGTLSMPEVRVGDKENNRNTSSSSSSSSSQPDNNNNNNNNNNGNNGESNRDESRSQQDSMDDKKEEKIKPPVVVGFKSQAPPSLQQRHSTRAISFNPPHIKPLSNLQVPRDSLQPLSNHQFSNPINTPKPDYSPNQAMQQQQQQQQQKQQNRSPKQSSERRRLRENSGGGGGGGGGVHRSQTWLDKYGHHRSVSHSHHNRSSAVSSSSFANNSGSDGLTNPLKALNKLQDKDPSLLAASQAHQDSNVYQLQVIRLLLGLYRMYNIALEDNNLSSHITTPTTPPTATTKSTSQQ